jgi:hypothetical protein
LERQLRVFLGPQPSREDLRHLTFLFANIMTWLAGGEPLSPEYLVRSTPTALPGRPRTTVLVHECLGPHRDARDTLNARRRDMPSEQPDEDGSIH